MIYESTLPKFTNLAINIGRKEPNYALEVHGRIAKIPMAAPAGIMYDSNVRTDKPFIPGQSEAGTQIDILIVKKIALIEAVEFFKYRSRKKHEHAGDPVGA